MDTLALAKATLPIQERMTCVHRTEPDLQRKECLYLVLSLMCKIKKKTKHCLHHTSVAFSIAV